MLNDPMEANALQVYLDCVGAGYTFDCGKVHPIIEEWQNRYRILSVSAIPDSPIMWAHYASGYSGCCLIYSTKKTFSKIEPIIYTDITFSLSDEDFMDEDIPSEAIEESLRFKHKDWAYENEWRLIQNEDAGFLNYEVSDHFSQTHAPVPPFQNPCYSIFPAYYYEFCKPFLLPVDRKSVV